MIFENAQSGYFPGKEAGLFFGVTLTNAKQDDQSVGDLGDGLAIYDHLSGFNPLNEGAHTGGKNKEYKTKYG